MQSMLTPVLALVCWTLAILIFMGFRRFSNYAVLAESVKQSPRNQELKGLPDKAVWAADNYNHLHEQPTLFYALAIYSDLAGVADPLNVGLGWLYVASRVLHSLVQVTSNDVKLRSSMFFLGTFALIAIAARNVIALAVV